MNLIPIVVPAFLLSVATICVATPVAVKVGLVDKPGGHKLHEDHVPLVGGIAIFLSVSLAWILVPILGLGSMNTVFIAAGGLLFSVGLLDDRFQLSVRFKFGAQVIAAALLIYSNTILHDLGYLFSHELFALGMFAVPVTLFAIVAAINAMNMLDGVDGLAGLVSFVSFSLLMLVAYVAGSQVELLLSLCVMGAIGGFLVFNMPGNGREKASIFMGDAGSTLLGLLLAYLLISLSQGEQPAMSPVTALWIFAVPLMDTLGVILRRIWLGKSPFSADRGHIHHLLLDAGFRKRQAVVVIALLQLLLGGIGLAGCYLGVPEVVLMVAFFGACGIYAHLVSRPWRIVPRFRTLHQKSGLTVQGVRHIYVGNLAFENAVAESVAEIEALLGGSAETCAFEIYHCASSRDKRGATYALVDAGNTENVKPLLAGLRYASSVIKRADFPATDIDSSVIRQYIVRNPDNDLRYRDRGGQECSMHRGERRAGMFRRVYCSSQKSLEPRTAGAVSSAA